MSYNNEKAVTEQPGAIPNMAVAGNRNAKNLPIDADGREWSNGLFDCFNDPGTCIVSWFCPCITYGQNKRRYEHLNNSGSPDPEAGGLMNGDCFVHCAITSCCGAGWILQMMNRGSVRTRYNIKGSGVTDCLTSAFCTPCELTQEAQELALEEASFSGQGQQ